MDRMPRHQFAIRKVNTYLIDDPGPPRRIEENVKVGECSLDVPEDIDLSDLPDCSTDKTYTGYGFVLAQTLDGQVVPQELPFMIDAESIEEAFSKFESGIESKIRELEKQNQGVKPPTPQELAALSRGNNSGGIIVP